MTKVELRQVTDQLTELVGGGDNRRVAALIDDDTMDIVGWCFVKVADDGSTSVVSETYKSILEMVTKEGGWVKKEKIVGEACKWLEDNFISKCGTMGFSGSIININTKPAIDAFDEAFNKAKEKEFEKVQDRVYHKGK